MLPYKYCILTSPQWTQGITEKIINLCASVTSVVNFCKGKHYSVNPSIGILKSLANIEAAESTSECNITKYF